MKLILTLITITLILIGCSKPYFIKINEQISNECYYDMQINSNFICD